METGRRFDADKMPENAFVCVITTAELDAGVLAARDVASRASRMSIASDAARLTPLPLDDDAAHAWAAMRVVLAEAGRRINVNDLWIAAVAKANGMPVISQDDDFDALADLGLIEVVKV